MQDRIEQLRTDGPKALKGIYQDHRGEFIQWARHHFNSPEDEAREIFQDAVIVLYENVMSGKLKELTSSLKTYLFAIGKYKFQELKRYQSRLTSSEQIDLPEEKEPEQDETMLKAARESIDKLSGPCRKLLVNFYYHNFTMQQLADSLGYKNEDTVKSQKYRCLQSLRKIFTTITVKRQI